MNKKLSFSVILLLLAICMHAAWDGTTIEPITNGDGTAANPYLIENEAQWAWLSSMGYDLDDVETYYAEDVNYLLTADLNFNDKPFPMLAPYAIPEDDSREPYNFKGFFDGGNHTIKGVKCITSTEPGVGLIRTAGVTSVIANVHVVGGEYKSAGKFAAGIVSTSGGKILNCSTKDAKIDGTDEHAGIVAGHYATSVLQNCFVRDIIISSGNFKGALVSFSNGQRMNSYSSVGPVNGDNINGIGNWNAGEGRTINGYYNSDKTNSGGNNGMGGEGKTEAQLKSADILPLLNANQREYWTIDLTGTINDGFPYQKNSYRVVLPEKEGLVFSIETGYDDLFFPEGDEYKFKMTVSDPSMSAENLVLKDASGNVLTADANGIYTIENISERQVVTIEGDLVIKTYTYDLTYDDTQGTVSADIDEGDPVEYGSNVVFTITPETGYVIDKINLNTQNVSFTGNTYTVQNVTADFSLEVLFAKQTFEIIVTKSAGGSVDVAAGSVNPVTYGEDITFVVTPETGYEVETVEMDGVTVSLTDGKYTFTNVTEAHTIDVTFALKQYTITASAGEGGTIDPDGEVSVSHGLNQVFTITPDANYKVASVLVDNATASLTDGKYTFANVTGAHTISVTFESTVGLKNALANGWTITTANDLIQITSADVSSFDVQLYNVSGKLLSITASEGNTAYVNAAPGSAYIVKIVCENETFTVKVAN